MKGTKQYRFEQNPEEELFYKIFIEHCSYNNTTLSQIIFGTKNNGEVKEWATERDEIVSINLIQWLGSPVGQGFLDNCGYIKKNESDNTTTNTK